jgi:DNA-binding transcriptional ArsR family regulator
MTDGSGSAGAVRAAQIVTQYVVIGSDNPISASGIHGAGSAGTSRTERSWRRLHSARDRRCGTLNDVTAPPGEPPTHSVAPGGRGSGSAVLGVASPEAIDDWTELFAALADSNRLRILLAVHHSPGICVTDLAEVVGMTANATSHALAALRLRGVVRSERSGRERRWRIASPEIHDLLHQVGATHSPLHPHH